MTSWQLLSSFLPRCQTKRIPSSRLFLYLSPMFCEDGVGWCSTCKRRPSIHRESKPLQSAMVRNYLAEIRLGNDATWKSPPQAPAKDTPVSTVVTAPARHALRLRPSFPFRLGSSGRGGAGRGRRSPTGPRPQGASWPRLAQPRRAAFWPEKWAGPRHAEGGRAEGAWKKDVFYDRP